MNTDKTILSVAITLVILGSIFSVIERVFGRGRNRAQPIIRKGWLTDVVYWFTTKHPGMNPRGAIDKP